MFGEDALSGIYDISPAGTVSMPLIGPIMAAGRTRAEVEHAITRAYASGKFLQEPKITVSVITYRPFSIFGEVTDARQLSLQTWSRRAGRCFNGRWLHLSRHLGHRSDPPCRRGGMATIFLSGSCAG